RHKLSGTRRSAQSGCKPRQISLTLSTKVRAAALRFAARRRIVYPVRRTASLGGLTKISVLSGYAAALIASVAMAASHPALFTDKQAHLFITGVPPGSKTLYDQNKDPSGSHVFSEHSESGFGDTQGADDFVVPNG